MRTALQEKEEQHDSQDEAFALWRNQYPYLLETRSVPFLEADRVIFTQGPVLLQKHRVIHRWK